MESSISRAPGTALSPQNGKKMSHCKKSSYRRDSTLRIFLTAAGQNPRQQESVLSFVPTLWISGGPGHHLPPNFVPTRGPGHDQPPNFVPPRGPGHHPQAPAFVQAPEAETLSPNEWSRASVIRGIA